MLEEKYHKLFIDWACEPVKDCDVFCGVNPKTGDMFQSKYVGYNDWRWDILQNIRKQNFYSLIDWYFDSGVDDEQISLRDVIHTFLRYPYIDWEQHTERSIRFTVKSDTDCYVPFNALKDDWAWDYRFMQLCREKDEEFYWLVCLSEEELFDLFPKRLSRDAERVIGQDDIHYYNEKARMCGFDLSNLSPDIHPYNYCKCKGLSEEQLEIIGSYDSLFNVVDPNMPLSQIRYIRDFYEIDSSNSYTYCLDVVDPLAQAALISAETPITYGSHQYDLIKEIPGMFYAALYQGYPVKGQVKYDDLFNFLVEV